MITWEHNVIYGKFICVWSMIMASSRRLRHSISSGDLTPPADMADDNLQESVDNFGGLSSHNRANSDTNLAHITLSDHSTLTVDEFHHTLGKGKSVKVEWNIHEEVCATDWIGLFLTGLAFYFAIVFLMCRHDEKTLHSDNNDIHSPILDYRGGGYSP